MLANFLEYKVLKLLLIEDNPDDIYLIQEYLSQNKHPTKFQLMIAQSLQEGIGLLNNLSFDAILLDLSLPDSQGLSTLSQLNQLFPNTTMLVMTGLDDHDLGLKAIEMGAQDYLVKDYLNSRLLIKSILFAIERRLHKQELKNLIEERTMELSQAKQELQHLMKNILDVQEQQKKQLSREVHDVLGQSLTSLRMNVDIIKHLLGEQAAPQVLEQIQWMEQIIQTAIEDIRRIARDLRPRLLDDLGLFHTLEWQAQQYAKQTKLKVTYQELSSQDELKKLQLNPLLSTALFRVFQEAFTNIMRHAQATCVNVSVQLTPSELCLSIKDNGIGYQINPNKMALGILGMKERVLPWNGKIKIHTLEEGGTELLASIPLPLTEKVI